VTAFNTGVAIAKYRKGYGLLIKYSQPGTASLELTHDLKV